MIRIHSPRRKKKILDSLRMNSYNLYAIIILAKKEKNNRLREKYNNKKKKMLLIWIILLNLVLNYRKIKIKKSLIKLKLKIML